MPGMVWLRIKMCGLEVHRSPTWSLAILSVCRGPIGASAGPMVLGHITSSSLKAQGMKRAEFSA